MYLHIARRYPVPLVKNGYKITNDIPQIHVDESKLCTKCSDEVKLLQPFLLCCLCKRKVHWTCLTSLQRKAIIDGEMNKDKWYCMTLNCLQKLGGSNMSNNDISVENVTKNFIENVLGQK